VKSGWASACPLMFAKNSFLPLEKFKASLVSG